MLEIDSFDLHLGNTINILTNSLTGNPLDHAVIIKTGFKTHFKEFAE
jgi:hypothetical protein